MADLDPDTRTLIAGLNLKPKLAPRSEAILGRYVCDMESSLREAARVLRKTGKAIYVVGENTIRGTYVPNAKIIVGLAEIMGLSLSESHSRVLPMNRRYLPPPSRGGANLDNRMRREVVLIFTVPAER